MKYNDVKQELLKRGCKTTHFTKQFYNDFIKAIRTMSRDSYDRDGDSYDVKQGPITIKLFHAYDAIYNSKFYIKNGPAYCEFLCVINPVYEKLAGVH